MEIIEEPWMQRSLEKLFPERNEPAFPTWAERSSGFRTYWHLPNAGPWAGKGTKTPQAQQLSWDKGNSANFNGQVWASMVHSNLEAWKTELANKGDEAGGCAAKLAEVFL